VVQVVAAAAIIIIVAGEGVSGVSGEAEAIAVWRACPMVPEAEIAVPVMMPVCQEWALADGTRVAKPSITPATRTNFNIRFLSIARLAVLFQFHWRVSETKATKNASFGKRRDVGRLPFQLNREIPRRASS
jgi:hypothetical protein